MQSLRICLILVLEGVVFYFIWLKYLFGTVIIYSDFILNIFVSKYKSEYQKKKKKADPCFPIFWVGQKRANKHLFFFLGLTFSVFYIDIWGISNATFRYKQLENLKSNRKQRKCFLLFGYISKWIFAISDSILRDNITSHIILKTWFKMNYVFNIYLITPVYFPTGWLWPSFPVLLPSHTVRITSLCSPTLWVRTDVHSKRGCWECEYCPSTQGYIGSCKGAYLYQYYYQATQFAWPVFVLSQVWVRSDVYSKRGCW